MYTRFFNGVFVDKGSVLDQTELYVHDATATICPKPTDSSLVVNNINLRQQYLSPGLIDVQNNGVFGCNFLQLNKDEQICQFESRYSQALQRYLATGVTATCPTITLSTPLLYQKLLPVYKRTRSRTQTDSLGAHLEGPFISPVKNGCHPKGVLQPTAANGTFDFVYGDSSCRGLGVDDDWHQNVCIVTAAPEIPGILELIPHLISKNMVFSIGHTEASQAMGREAVAAGATMITHLYNAMPQPHHREAGIVGLISDPNIIERPYYGLICDGYHVDPSMAVLAYRADPNKCVLTTDAMHLLGMPDGLYDWGDQVMDKSGPVLCLQGTKTLAGAATTLPQCIRNIMLWSHITLPEAVKLCTNNAAESLNISDERGFLDYGCVADFVTFDSEGFVSRVFKCNNEYASSDLNPRRSQPLVALL